MLKMTKRQEIAIKFALDTMNRNFRKYCMSSYKYKENGESQSMCFGEAIGELEDMITFAEDVKEKING